MRETLIRICNTSVGADCDTARKPSRQGSLLVVSAVARTVLVAAMFAAVAIASPYAAPADRSISPSAPSADGTSEHFFTVEIVDVRLADATRRQVAAAFSKALAAAGIDVSRGDFAAAVDEAMRQLADWNGELPLRGCTSRLCWELVSFEPVTSEIGIGQSK